MEEIEELRDGLFPYQRRDANELVRIFRTRHAALNGGDTGTGKTYTTCAVSRLMGKPIFGVVPKAVVNVWFDIGHQTGTEILGITNYESAKNGKYYQLANEFFAEERSECPYLRKVIVDDVITWEWDLPDNTLLVFDEAHRGKNGGTQTSKLMESAMKVVQNVEKGCKILILSATITDSIDCFRTPAYILGLAQRERHAYRAWIRTLKVVGREGAVGRVEGRGAAEPGLETEAEMLHRVVYVSPATKCGVRTRIRDLHADMDEIVRALFRGNDILAQTYDMSPEVEAEIEAAYIAIEAALRDLKTKQQGEIHPLTIILRARQRIEMLKVPTLVMLAMEYVDQNKSVVIFVNFTETITRLFEQLDPFIQDEHRSFITFINGGQTPEDRKYNIESFRADRSRIMISNISAGGVGISLDDKKGDYGRVSLISPTWSSIQLKQVLGRIHRAGSRTDAIQRIVYCKGRVSKVGGKLPEDAIGIGGGIGAGPRVLTEEERARAEAEMGNDTTFNSKEGRGKIGVEELIAENVNKKLKTIEWLNNGDDDDLHLI